MQATSFELVVHFQTILDRDNAVNVSNAFLSHLLLKVRSHPAVQNDMTFTGLTSKRSTRQIGILVDCVLDFVFKTDDRFVHIMFCLRRAVFQIVGP